MVHVKVIEDMFYIFYIGRPKPFRNMLKSPVLLDMGSHLSCLTAWRTLAHKNEGFEETDFWHISA